MENNKQKTAVEWLYIELSKNNRSTDSIIERINKESNIWKQAKEMEKQQQGYSEEEVLDILYKHTEDLLAGKKLTLEEWFEQFKKK
jgi:hypothetical protein